MCVKLIGKVHVTRKSEKRAKICQLHESAIMRNASVIVRYDHTSDAVGSESLKI